ncbi:hypothetical protein D3C73_404320 [compost metagenome]
MILEKRQRPPLFGDSHLNKFHSRNPRTTVGEKTFECAVNRVPYGTAPICDIRECYRRTSPRCPLRPGYIR